MGSGGSSCHGSQVEVFSMHTPSPQSMDRVMTQHKITCDLAHTDSKALKTPLEAGQ